MINLALFSVYLVISVFACFFLLFRLKKTPEISGLLENKYRILLFWAVTFTMAMRVATAFFEDNRFFFFCLLGAGLICYLSLCWFSLASGTPTGNRLKLILRPYSFLLLLLSLSLVLVCFRFAGSDFATINFAKSNDSIKSPWLSLGISIAQIYIFCSLAFCVLENWREIKRRRYGTQPKFKYRFHSFALVMAAAAFYIGMGLVGTAFYWRFGSEGVSNYTFKIRDTICIVFLLVAFCIHVFFNLKMVLLLDWLYQRNLLKLAEKLRWFYELTLESFPANYRFNAYEVYAQSRKSKLKNSPRWLLDTVLLSFSDMDWSINPTGSLSSKNDSLGEQDSAQIKKEAEKWYHYLLTDPADPYLIDNEQPGFSAGKAVISYKIEVPNRIEEAAEYYIKLGNQVRHFQKSTGPEPIPTRLVSRMTRQ